MTYTLNHPQHHDVGALRAHAGRTVYKFLMAQGEDLSGRLFMSDITEQQAREKAQSLLDEGGHTLVTVSRIEVPSDYPDSRPVYSFAWSGTNR